MSEDYLYGKYMAQTAAASDSLSLPSEIMHGAVASVVDFGASVWNTIPVMLGADEVNTADLLSRIDSSALQVYNEHPDAVHAASFIGGAFIPAGLAIKGMNALRAGAKGVSWFSNAGKASKLGEVENLFSNSLSVSQEVKKISSSLYAATAANALIDSAAAEAAIVLTMGAHPWMEDYNKDFKTNFAIGTAIGAGLGGALGIIGDRAIVKGIGSRIATASQKEVGAGLVFAPEAADAATQMQTKKLNIDILEGKLAAAETPDVSGYKINGRTKALLKDTLERNKSELKDAFVNNAKGDLAKADADIIKHYTDLSSTNPAWTGINEFRYFKPNDAEIAISITGTPTSTPNLVKQVMKKDGSMKDTFPSAIHIPSDVNGGKGFFVSIRDANHYTSLVDNVQDIKSVQKFASNMITQVADVDAEIYLGVIPTHQAELYHAASTIKMEKMPVEELNKYVISPTDLPKMKALAHKIETLSPEERAKISVTVTNTPPTYGARVQKALSNAGVAPDLPKRLQKLADSFDSKFSMSSKGESFAEGVSPELKRHIDNWINGGTSDWRKVTSGARTKKDSPYYKTLEELRTHPRSVALRENLLEQADVEGNIYLYRGIKGTPTGHHGIESFTLTGDKASQFGTDIKLFKVHVEDIVGGFKDIGGGQYNDEILVLAPTRENVTVPFHKRLEVPPELIRHPVTDEVLDTVSSFKLSADEIQDSALSLFKKNVLEMSAQDRSATTIALRTGSSEQAVMSVLTKGEVGIKDIQKFKSTDDVMASLDMTKRALKVKASPAKYRNSQVLSNMNVADANAINSELVDYQLKSSTSSTVRAVGEYFGTHDANELNKALHDSIDNVTVEGMGSSFWSSSNQALRNFGDAGKIATAIGTDVMHMMNTMQDKFISPIAKQFATIQPKQSLIYEMNHFINEAAKIKGWSTFDEATGKFMQMTKDATGKKVLTPVQIGGKDLEILSPEVRTMFTKFQETGREMYEFNNVTRKALGKAPITDKGFWMPAFNPRDKHIAYMHDTVTDEITLLHARSPGELNDAVTKMTAKLEAEGNKTTKIFRKGTEQKMYNNLAGRHDPMAMKVADVSLEHKGIASATVSTNADVITEIINGYDAMLARGIRGIVDVKLSPTMARLKAISEQSQYGYEKGTLSNLQAMIRKPVDPGQTMRNTILGIGNLAEHEAWQDFQQGSQVFIERGLQTIHDVFAPLLQPVKGKLLGKGVIRNEDTYKQLATELEAKGIPNPFAVVDEYSRYIKEGMGHTGNLTPRLVALSNGLAATMLLRFADVAQPFVNMVSLPILTSSAVNRKLQASFMGSTLDPNAKFTLTSAMHDGIRLMNNKTVTEIFDKVAIEKNLFKPMVSEANNTMRLAKSAEAGIISKIEDSLESNLVHWAAWGADKSETLVRKMSFYTGIGLAKKAYPGLSDTGAVTFARDFMNEALGNYSAAQRPALFQGTVGVAMGLFQTYMLTLAQNMYRHIEAKEWKALGKMMLTQNTIFGSSSLPGFHVISETIGEHFSDEHYDLESGTFRAVNDEAANILLYGLASSFGPGVTTRGDIQPRIPNPVQGLDSLAAVNMAKQTYTLGENLVKAAFAADGNTGRAMLEALSLQSISRPAARISELLTGTSLTSKGNIVAQGEEIYTPLGVISRIMATRPLKEIKAREAMQLDHVYGAIDSDNRAAITSRLKTAIREGTLDGELTQTLQEEYMRSGTADGWRSSVNTAIGQTYKQGYSNVRDNLGDDKPWQQMMNDL